MFWWFMDYWYLVLVLPAVILTLIVQIRVKSVFHKYSQHTCAYTGAAASRMIQDANGLQLPIVPVAGSMTDYYDPRSRSIHLSDTVRDMATVAAVGVAAHETGHALQYAKGYFPARLRTTIVPVTNFASSISMYLVILGLVLSYDILAYAGVLCFGFAVFFQLVTLPVEFNASRRAMASLRETGRFTDEQLKGVRRVLTAAALTYVAALFLSLMNFLRLLLIVNGRRRR